MDNEALINTQRYEALLHAYWINTSMRINSEKERKEVTQFPLVEYGG